MHPLVIAQCHLDRLLSAVESLTNTFNELPKGQETIDLAPDGEPVLAGEVNGWSYLLECHGTMFAGCWGFLARMAQALDSIVIGASWDPGEEHCEFFAAKDDKVIRAVWSNPNRTTRPYTLGEPLSSEGDLPLTTSGAAGLNAALRAFGFELMDFNLSFERSPGDRWITWKGDGVKLFEGDPFREPINNHVRAFPNPMYQGIKAVVKVHKLR